MICINGMCISIFNFITIVCIGGIIYYLYSKAQDNLNSSDNKLLVNKIDLNEEKLLSTPVDNKIDKFINYNNQNNQNNHQYNHQDNHQDNYNNIDHSKGIPININTRPVDNIEQLGILYKDEIENATKIPGNNSSSVVLPLFGRSKYRGSNKWIYYTSTDSHNSVRIPIYHKNKHCNKEIGCDELYDGDLVSIPSLNGTFKVNLYEKEGMQYIPYI